MTARVANPARGPMLLRVPPAGPEVCSVCHGPCHREFAVCQRCALLEQSLPDAVAFVSLAPRGEPLAANLLGYKDVRLPAGHRRNLQQGLAGLLRTWLAAHEACVARQAGTVGFDLLATVPSRLGRHPHPVAELLVGEHRLSDPLRPAAGAFAAEPLSGRPAVLLIDDAWASGRTAHAAALALRAAGAGAVGLVAVGRWVNPATSTQARWLAQHRQQPWEPHTCCLEPARRAA